MPGGVRQCREHNGGYHRWSQNHSELAGNPQPSKVRWPSGGIDNYSAVAANRIYRATEGQPIAALSLSDRYPTGRNCASFALIATPKDA